MAQLSDSPLVDRTNPSTTPATRLKNEGSFMHSESSNVITDAPPDSSGSSTAPSNDDPWRSIVLSLDGGGIRGLSSLYILREIMIEISRREHEAATSTLSSTEQSSTATSTDVVTGDQAQSQGIAGTENGKEGDNTPLPLPCHYFDFMVGTSTGGLIAVMLGRLRMDINDCIDAYHEFGLSIFRPQTLRLLRHISSKFQYSSTKFNAAVQKVVNTNCRRCKASQLSVCENPNHQLFRQPDYAERDGKKDFVNKTCRSSVVALRKAGRNSDGERGAEVPYLFRTYDHRRRGGMGEFNPKQLEASDLKISEACRATSAAPTWFPPVTIRGRRYLDGALADQNNPSKLAWYEAKEMSYRNPRALLSIGTGKQKVPGRHGSILNLLRAARYQLTDTEGAHQDTERIARDNGCDYWRLNVPVSNPKSSVHRIKGLETIKLDACNKYDKIEERTLQYCKSEVGKAVIEAAALSLFELSQERQANDPSRWQQFRDHPNSYASSENT